MREKLSGLRKNSFSPPIEEDNDSLIKWWWEITLFPHVPFLFLIYMGTLKWEIKRTSEDCLISNFGEVMEFLEKGLLWYQAKEGALRKAGVGSKKWVLSLSSHSHFSSNLRRGFCGTGFLPYYVLWCFLGPGVLVHQRGSQQWGESYRAEVGRGLNFQKAILMPINCVPPYLLSKGKKVILRVGKAFSTEKKNCL